MGNETRGANETERREICENEIFPSDPLVLANRIAELESIEDGFVSLKCKFCWCEEELCDEECFSPDSSVQTEDRGTVLMKELQLGDSILTSSGQYKKVQAFQTHNLPAPDKAAQ